MRVGIACDHGGFTLKTHVLEVLNENGCDVIDMGTDSFESVDYPDFAVKALELLATGKCDRIVLMCGTGIGMSMCANRVQGVRAGLCHDSYTARMSRLHNNSNCLILGGRTTGPAVAREIVQVWLDTPFEGGRHQRRLEKLERIQDMLKRGGK